MRTTFWKRPVAALAAGLALLVLAGQAYSQDEPRPGIVRISDKAPADAKTQVQPVGHNAEGKPIYTPTGPEAHFGCGNCGHCDECQGDSCQSGGCGTLFHRLCQRLFHRDRCEEGCEEGGDCDQHRCSLFGCSKCGKHGSDCNGNCDGQGGCNGNGGCNGRSDCACNDCLARLRCKFGYFCPQGCGGAGCPPYGCYHMGYAVNPEHYDYRDGGVYAAPGYGLPMAVPLAPNVNHTYNYGWGIPSSRLTPVARRVREPGIIPMPQAVVRPPYPPRAPVPPGPPTAAAPGYPYGYPYPNPYAAPGAAPPAQNGENGSQQN